MHSVICRPNAIVLCSQKCYNELPLVLPPPVIIGWGVRSWVWDPLGSFVTYQQKKCFNLMFGSYAFWFVLSLNAGKSHMLPIIYDLWYWYISYIVHHKLKFTLDFSGGAQGRSFGAIYTWDGALSTEARDACSVEQRFIIALCCFLSLICMYHLFRLTSFILFMVCRCCGASFWLCCLWRGKAFVPWVSSYTG